MQIPHGQDATTVARRNLIRIANDGKYLGGTNAGYCHWFAGMRMLLSCPEFIRFLRNFKRNYFRNNQVIYDDNILKILDANKIGYPNLNTKISCWPLIELLCRRTDDYGNLNVEAIVNNHDVFPSLQNALRDLSPNHGMQLFEGSYYKLQNLLSIINETNVNYKFGEFGLTNRLTAQDYNDLELILNSGKCITVGADQNHFYNVLKDKSGYWVIGSWKPKLYYNLKNAIESHSGNNHGIFTPPVMAMRLHLFNVEKEIELYRKYGYKPWQHGHIKIGEDPLPEDKRLMLDYLVNQIKQAEWNKQIAWNNFLNYQNIKNQYMMNFCCNNWHYNNNLGIIAFNNACKVVNNNPILKAYYNQKINGK